MTFIRDDQKDTNQAHDFIDAFFVWDGDRGVESIARTVLRKNPDLVRLADSMVGQTVRRITRRRIPKYYKVTGWRMSNRAGRPSDIIGDTGRPIMTDVVIELVCEPVKAHTSPRIGQALTNKD